MKKEELIKYWIEASEVDLKAMKNLFKSGDYVWSLFIGHLVIEKLLKAVAVYNDSMQIIKIHDLNKLAKSAGLKLDDEKKNLFDVITSFNIEARYPDFKKEFYKKCNLKFTSGYIEKIEKLRLWLLDQLNI
jgi:HEPN domain-containing protein